MKALLQLQLLLGVTGAYAQCRGAWTLQQRAPPDASIQLHIGLTPQISHHGVAQIALGIATPGHDQYRKHLSVQDLQEVLAVPAAAADATFQWLRSAGLPSSGTRLRGNIIDAQMSIEQAERLLNTEYNVYSDGCTDILRSQSYILPEELQHAVDFVSPTTLFPTPRKEPLELPKIEPTRVTRRDDCGSNDQTSPSCIRQVYNITYTAQPNRTRFAVYATEASSFNPTDIQKFLETYNKPASEAKAQYNVVGSGDPANGSPGIEGQFETALDTQTALGLAFPATGTLYDLGGVFGPKPGQTYDRFVRFLQDLMHNETVPSVISFSESNTENQFTTEYARSLCSMMAAIGARGVTLVFSAGNNGPQGDPPGTPHRDIFEPKFPASCPFVLSVGGTTDLAQEKAATQDTITGLNKAGYVASGGGFSNYFSRPSYQSAAVQGYVANQIPEAYFSKSGFCSNGRGYPDVSAFSTSFPVVVNGSTIPIGGTSAAAPTWAAIVTLMNDYEASKGRPPLGFINPWLYSLRSGELKDMVGGNNAGQCTAGSQCTLSETPGFNVTTGWDPVTGLGSPLFPKLLQALDQQAQGNDGKGNSSSGNTTFLDFACGSYQQRSGNSTNGSAPKSSAAKSWHASTLTASVVLTLATALYLA